VALRVSIHSLTFSDGTRVELKPDSILVIVGPNNSGKSQALRDVRHVADVGGEAAVARNVAWRREGEVADLESWFNEHCMRQPVERGTFAFRGAQDGIRWDTAQKLWRRPDALGHLATFFVSVANTEGRLSIGNDSGPYDRLNTPPQTPVQALFHDEVLERSIAERVHLAFGMQLAVGRGYSSTIPLFCGERVGLLEGENLFSRAYLDRLRQVPRLQHQGDGIRSFVGCLLHMYAQTAFVVLIDEPEAFLHPPQARYLGRLVSEEGSPKHQLLIATHSADLLRGLLEGEPERLSILRLTRRGDVNPACVLQAGDITELWSDPILRFSSAFDGLFHAAVLVCEADADCRFYSAVLDAIARKLEKAPPDVLFLPSGGKDRAWIISKALRACGVRTGVIQDFDALRDEASLKRTAESLSIPWPSCEAKLRRVCSAIEQKGPALLKNQVRERIGAILDRLTSDRLDQDTTDEIKRALRASSPWGEAKRLGTRWLPQGEIRSTCSELLDLLRTDGLFIVELGQLESFVPSVGGHGPGWVASALQKDLLSDSELADARGFGERLYAWITVS